MVEEYWSTWNVQERSRDGCREGSAADWEERAGVVPMSISNTPVGKTMRENGNDTGWSARGRRRVVASTETGTAIVSTESAEDREIASVELGADRETASAGAVATEPRNLRSRRSRERNDLGNAEIDTVIATAIANADDRGATSAAIAIENARGRNAIVIATVAIARIAATASTRIPRKFESRKSPLMTIRTTTTRFRHRPRTSLTSNTRTTTTRSRRSTEFPRVDPTSPPTTITIPHRIIERTSYIKFRRLNVPSHNDEFIAVI